MHQLGGSTDGKWTSPFSSEYASDMPSLPSPPLHEPRPMACPPLHSHQSRLPAASAHSADTNHAQYTPTSTSTKAPHMPEEHMPPRMASSGSASLEYAMPISGKHALQEIEWGKPLGEGCVGVVRQARWRGMDVAVKVIKSPLPAASSTANAASHLGQQYKTPSAQPHLPSSSSLQLPTCGDAQFSSSGKATLKAELHLAGSGLPPFPPAASPLASAYLTGSSISSMPDVAGRVVSGQCAVREMDDPRVISALDRLEEEAALGMVLMHPNIVATYTAFTVAEVSD